MNKYVFVDSENVIKGICTSEYELTADEVYPGMNYSAIEVEDDEIINKFSMYEFDGINFNIKEIPVQPIEPNEIDILGQQLVEKDLQILDLQNENQTLGQQLVDIDLRLLQGGL